MDYDNIVAGASMEGVRMRIRRLGTLTVLTVLAALTFATAAQASGYWNVYQGNLPEADGTRTELGSNTSDMGNIWTIRMSWTSGSHDMHFVLVKASGSWAIYDTDSYGTDVNPPSPYDLKFEYLPSGFGTTYSHGGCQNPSGLSSVYVNCRNSDQGV